MRKFTLLLSAILLFGTMQLSAQNINIVPRPLKLETTDDGVFKLSAKTPIRINVGEKNLNATAEIFSALVKPILGDLMPIQHKPHMSNGVNIKVKKSLDDEQYTISITHSRVDIAGGSPRAVMYGLQTLRQLIVGQDIKDGVAEIPTLKIDDKPKFKYRGGMMDVGRYYFPVEDVKKFIDILSLHKLNYFQWHLTDDQGWRIEIKRYPLLTQIGSIRAETHVGHYYDKKWDGKPYGGFYTQDEIREVVRYATDRNIEVIPEIELPGHATAALASYQWLGCKNTGYEVSTKWGVHKDLFCAGKDSTFDFLEGVLTEVIELFPSKYIHIGGDECPKDRWKECPSCQQRIKANGLEDEEQLQSYFVQRMEKWLNGHGRSIIGWDEIMEGGLSKSATVMSWRGNKGGIQAAKMGNHVIMTPTTHFYLDYYQAPKENEPLAIGHLVTVAKAYSFNPYEGLEPSQYKFIWGVQGNLWGEYISTIDYAEYMFMPRIAAIAEIGWSHPYKDYDDFVRRMQTLRRLYDYEGYNYGKHIFK